MGGAAVTNNAGSISSQVSANQPAGQSVVTYTGTGAASSGVTVGHGLLKAPELVITKARNAVGTQDWSVWHSGLGGNYGIWLNQASARSSNMWAGYTNFSSTVFSPPDLNYGNVSTAQYVNYCFHSVEGYSKVDRCVANGSADGTFVYCGFKPRYLLIKVATGTGGDWLIIDSVRNTYNVLNTTLRANTTAADESTNPRVDFTATGFKVRAGASVEPNQNGEVYIFYAVAEAPTKYTTGR
jgi:hypothetical protein